TLLAPQDRATIQPSRFFAPPMRALGSTVASRLVAATLVLAGADAAAMSLDPKAMARFDHSYAKCEAKYPEMKGARDEAYLSMWRAKADTPTRAQLATVRKGAAYQAESKRVQQEDAKNPVPESRLDSQCHALWGETQKVRSTRAASGTTK